MIAESAVAGAPAQDAPVQVAPEPRAVSTRKTSFRAHALLLLLVAYAVLMVGLQRSLPEFFDVDEDVFANAAARIVTTNNLDPGFYGTPGATTIYPLAIGYRLWFAVTQQGQLLAADPNFPPRFAQATLEYYWLGRFLSVAYALIAVALTCTLGRRVYNARVGIGAGWLVAFHGIAVYNAKQVRTDSAATALALLALYCIVRLLDVPSSTRRLYWQQIVAGVAIGLAVASRYYMAVLGAVLAFADLMVLWRAPKRVRFVLPMLAAFVIIPIAFLLANPAMLPNWQAVVAGLRAETVTEHLGGDGLGFGGNLWWYLSNALPAAITWLQVIAAACGLVLAWRQKRAATTLLAAYLVLTLVGVSLSPRHFQRYLIQILPVVAIFAAVAIDSAAHGLAAWRSWTPRVTAWLFAAGILLLLANPASDASSALTSSIQAATRVYWRAIGWLPMPRRRAASCRRNMARRSPTQPCRAKQSARCPTLSILRPPARTIPTGSPAAKSTTATTPNPLATPTQIALYEALFASDALVAEFPTTWYRSGPTIRIFRTDALPADLSMQP